MIKLFRKILCLTLCCAFVAGFSAEAMADDSTKPYASFSISNKSATLRRSGTSITLDFSVQATATCSQLGVSSVALHDTTTGKITNYSGKTASGVSSYSNAIRFSGTPGHTYYALVSFTATPYSASTVRASITTNKITL